jgi:hypothetical protein
VGIERLEEAARLYETLGDTRASARAMAAIAESLWMQNRLEEAISLSRRAVQQLPEGSAEQAAALADLSHHLAFQGDHTEALATADDALSIAEPMQDWETVVQAMGTVSYLRTRRGRIEEALALRERCLKLALENDLSQAALRSYNNLADIPLQLDRFQEARDAAEPGLTLATARGDRMWEEVLSLMVLTADVGLGHWDAALSRAGEMERTADLLRLAFLPLLARIHAARGELEPLRRTLDIASGTGPTTNAEYVQGPEVARAIALNAFDRPREALAAALPVALGGPEVANEDRREAYQEAGRAALTLDDEATVEQLVSYVEELPAALRSPLLAAGAARLAAALAQRHDDPESADRHLTAAVLRLREIEAPFALGQVLLEHAELLLAGGREAEASALLSEAEAIFERLRARPWHERAQAARTRVAA